MRTLYRDVKWEGRTVYNLYRIKRNANGVLVCDLVGRRSPRDMGHMVENDPDKYARGMWCARGRRATSYDLCQAAGLATWTDDGIVRDWYDEHLPLDGDTWRRLERKRKKAEAAEEKAVIHLLADALLGAG